MIYPYSILETSNPDRPDIEALDMMLNPAKIPQYLTYLQMAETEIRLLFVQDVNQNLILNFGKISTCN